MAEESNPQEEEKITDKFYNCDSCGGAHPVGRPCDGSGDDVRE